MRKLLAVFSLILFMSFPVLCGHTQSGNFCSPCGTQWCICDEGELPLQGINGDSSEVETDSQDAPTSGLGDEALIIFLALVLMKLRA
jgi:hypothetical protein